MVLVKNWKFFHIVILGKIGKEEVFDKMFDREKPFLDYKKEVEKVEELAFFKRVLSIVLVKYLKFFCLVLLGKIDQKNVFDDILER